MLGCLLDTSGFHLPMGFVFAVFVCVDWKCVYFVVGSDCLTLALLSGVLKLEWYCTNLCANTGFTVSTVVITSFFLPFVHVFDASTADVRPWRVGSAMTADLSKNGIDRLLLVHLPKLNVYQGSRPPGRWSRGYGVLWRMGWRETAPPSS